MRGVINSCLQFPPDRGLNICMEQLLLFSAKLIRTWPTHAEIRAARRRVWESALGRDADAGEVAVDTCERIPVVDAGRDDDSRDHFKLFYRREDAAL
jgi:hypothetical protein